MSQYKSVTQKNEFVKGYECSGHGSCYDMKTLALLASQDLANPLISYGSDPNNPGINSV
jgi:hypothetical protein